MIPECIYLVNQVLFLRCIVVICARLSYLGCRWRTFAYTLWRSREWIFLIWHFTQLLPALLLDFFFLPLKVKLEITDQLVADLAQSDVAWSSRMIPSGGIMIVGDSPLLLLARRLHFVTAHVVSGLLPNISNVSIITTKHRCRRIEAICEFNILLLNIIIYDWGLLLFDRHLILFLKAVLFTLNYGLEALYL